MCALGFRAPLSCEPLVRSPLPFAILQASPFARNALVSHLMPYFPEQPAVCPQLAGLLSELDPLRSRFALCFSSCFGCSLHNAFLARFFIPPTRCTPPHSVDFSLRARHILALRNFWYVSINRLLGSAVSSELGCTLGFLAIYFASSCSFGTPSETSALSPLSTGACYFFFIRSCSPRPPPCSLIPFPPPPLFFFFHPSNGSFFCASARASPPRYLFLSLRGDSILRRWIFLLAVSLPFDHIARRGPFLVFTSRIHSPALTSFSLPAFLPLLFGGQRPDRFRPRLGPSSLFALFVLQTLQLVCVGEDGSFPPPPPPVFAVLLPLIQGLTMRLNFCGPCVLASFFFLYATHDFRVSKRHRPVSLP